jgi:DNA-binding transcriptional ArsR family regulator
MARDLTHPAIEDIDPADVLAALGEPTRLAIVLRLADHEMAFRCSAFIPLASASNLSYHLRKLREAGVTRTEIVGTSKYISLRHELDERFPGLLRSVIEAARRSPPIAAMAELAEAERRVPEDLGTPDPRGDGR